MNDESVAHRALPALEREPIIALSMRDRVLLEAAAMGDERAIAAWRFLREDPRLTRDPGSWNLLPNIYLNLRQLGVVDPRVDELRTFFAQHWTSNLLARRSVVIALAAMREAGIEAMAMKGLPLLLTCYRKPGARPMYDVDLLVRPNVRVSARAALTRAGWRASGMPDALAPFLHGEAFNHERWSEIDLHWRPFSVACPEQAEAGLWTRARRVSVEGFTVVIPSAEDLLTMVCYHAFRRDSQAPARYVLDLIELIRESGRTLDWEALITFARSADLLLPVRDCLLYVEREFGPLLPEHGLTMLASIRVDRKDYTRAARTFRALRRRPSGVVSRLLEHWHRHREVRIREGGTQTAGFARYLTLHYRYYWQHEKLSALFGEALRRRKRLWSVREIGAEETPDGDDRR